MLEVVQEWGASLCFAAAAAGICQMLAPESGLGRMLRVCVAAFFLCSVLLPLGKIELDFSDWEQGEAASEAEQISQEALQQSRQAGFEAVQGQMEQEVALFLRQQGITPVQIRIDMMQQGEDVQFVLRLTLSQQDRNWEEWLRENLQSEGLSLEIEYERTESDEGES